ncbi:MAG: hypothetical protein VKL41_14995 [Snowella sp.]|nr:hypothetical protein [Snowella sp.]
MAIFKAPRITTTQREEIVLQVSEIVFDTNLNRFYGGDGSTAGGFPIGKGLAGNTEVRTLTQFEIDNKAIILNNIPSDPMSVILTPQGGPAQINTIDFEVVGSIVSWDNLGLDSFLEVNEVLVIQY